MPEQTGPDDYPPGGVPEREPYEALGCQSYAECAGKYGEISVSRTLVETNFGSGANPPGSTPYRSHRQVASGDGLGASVFVIPEQPFSVTASFTVQNDFLGHGGLDAADADRFTFPCAVRWWDITSGSRSSPPRLVYGQWQGETWYGTAEYGRTCRIGHNENGDAPVVELGFYAEPTHCDDPNISSTSVNCPVNYGLNDRTALSPGAYRAWPEGKYEVALYVDNSNPTAADEPLAAREFEIQSRDRPDPWPLHIVSDADPLGERPADGGYPPPDYSGPLPGEVPPRPWPWPRTMRFTCASKQDYATCRPDRTTYDPDFLPYDPNGDCHASGICREYYPYSAPLPWGFAGNYEIRPPWGDYEWGADGTGISPHERTAPLYQIHTGFNFIYPQCPRLDWCHREPATPNVSRRDSYNDRQVVDNSVFGSHSGPYRSAPPTRHGGDPCEADWSECVPTYCDDNFPDCADEPCPPC